MSKTIEKLAKQYAEDMYPAEDYSDSDCDDGRDTDIAISIDDARSVLYWLFNKPLAQRLTEAEKIRMRNIYKELTECIENSISDVKYLKGKRTQLILIFGKDFFKEDKI